jgi:two-component system response regulator DesR
MAAGAREEGWVIRSDRLSAVPSGSVVVGSLEPLLARGLVSVLRDDLEVRVDSVGVEGVALRRAVAREQPVMVIVDAECCSLLRSIASSLGVVVLAREPHFSYGVLLLAAGVSCVASNASIVDFSDTIRAVARGGCRFVAADGERLELRDRDKESPLTPREAQVLTGLSERKSYAEIALELRVDASTIRKYAGTLVSKLQVASTRDLVGMSIPAPLRFAA